jgi:hypothetical protein
LLEDLAMAAFIVSSFGLFVMGLFAGLFTTPSWQTFTVLAYGWTVASGERQMDEYQKRPFVKYCCRDAGLE